MITGAPKGSWTTALVFIAIASILSAILTYKTTKYLEAKGL